MTTPDAISAPVSPRPQSARPRAANGGAITGERRWSDLAVIALITGMVAGTALVVLDAAAGRSGLVPPSPHIAAYLDGVGSRLDFPTFIYVLLTMSLCFAGLLALARRVRPRTLVAAIVILHVIVFVGPVLLSQDIFSYVAYGRLGVVHGLNPFVHGPSAIPHDHIYRLVGIQWRHVPSAYGPLFTLISYPLTPLGIEGAMWGFKVLGTLASLATVWLVWRSAQRLGRDPVLPAMVVGLNPVLVLYGVGGAHNDLIMVALMMLGVWLSLGVRDGWGAGAVVAAAAVKATAVAVLPFMLLGRRRSGVITGALAAAVAVGLVSLVAFGVHSLDFVSVLRRQQSFVSFDSFPTEVTHLFGLPGVFPVDRLLLRGALIGMVVYLLVAVWRGYDWVSGAAWAMLAIAVTTTWLLAWYTLWTLPLAAIARDRRVLVATLGVQALFIVHQCTPLFSPL
ncbi:MAG TPA: polyprenol phosphomannose-dependent alpha 1,6 mannosyltransferase MptB [Solirubrobacteraceae bacterium]|jgi:hypothetical protein|nr:polyprenol phosphomannose-dependent alpha 1,6 mannosyltransferase MptB [Solirubrobacteraceae bacterium]